MLDVYSKIKAGLDNNLIKFEHVATSEHIKSALLLLQSKLKADIFSIVVVGQFKRGKTTFINSLLGEDLLPTAIIPLTSIITKISYGINLNIVVFFESGNKKEIKLEDLPSYITEKNNPKNEKKVNRVEILYPSQYLKNGVQIIDTPGIASVHEHNTKTTYDYLPQADVAIFLLSVDPPLTQAELNFLHDLKKVVVKTLFVQNKIDTVNKSDREESLMFSKEIIEKQAGFDNIEIYPLSAKEALEAKKEKNLQKLEKSGLSNFIKSLERFLLEEKGEMLIKSATEKISNFIDEEIFLSKLEKKSLQLPLNELNNKITIFKKFIKDSDQEKIDSIRLLTEEIKVLQKETLIEDLEKLKIEKTKWFILKLKEFSIKHKEDSNTNFAELINKFIDAEIRSIFAVWRIEEEIKLKELIKNILERFTNRMNKILEQIVIFSAELFGIEGQSFHIQEILPSEIEFRFKTTEQSDILGLTVDLVRRILPKVLAHKLILNEAQEKAKIMVDRHSGKTHYDFSQRMEQLIQNYRSNVVKMIDSKQNDVLKALEEGIIRKKNTLAITTSFEKNISKRVETLQEINNSLQEMNTHI